MKSRGGGAVGVSRLEGSMYAAVGRGRLVGLKESISSRIDREILGLSNARIVREFRRCYYIKVYYRSDFDITI